MTSREIVRRAITFECPPRLPRSFPEPYGNDFCRTGPAPSPDARPRSGPDEWGAVWVNIGRSNMGEVKEFPLKDYADFHKLHIPDINEPHRWEHIHEPRKANPDKFLLAGGISLYERVFFIRGLENTWADIHEHPEELGRLIDVLVEMNLQAIPRFADAGADGLMWCDDWGLQDRLMIAPDDWRRIWKPRYARVYRAARDVGLLTLLHSCGHIVSILDDLVEIGLDVIQMDQQENMGLELLGERFAGRICFWCPVDIQNTMARGHADEIRAYCRGMVERLGTDRGGFMPMWYSDPVGAGHTPEAVQAMCEEFIRIGG